MVSRNVVPPADFTCAMETHWTGTLGNSTSLAFRQLWAVMATTFNEAVEKRDSLWRVLQPPTGTGKTQGAIVYSALMAQRNAEAPESRTGILMVVRTINQAEEIVEQINVLAGGQVAVTRHSENKQKEADCFPADVLVITHAAYQLAVGGVYRNDPSRWDSFINWEGGRRCLTIIDEALANIVEHHQVKAQDISNVLSVCDPDIRIGHVTQLHALERLKTIIEFVDFDQQGRERMLWREGSGSEIYWPDGMTMTSLVEEINRLPLDQIVLHSEDRLVRQRLREQYATTLRSCESALCRWAYYKRSGQWDTLNSAELLMPVDLPGPVVLDATASQNMMWELLGDRVVRPTFPGKARTYRNVKLHVAYARGLGQEKMEARGRHRLSRVVADLEQTCGQRSVLVCLHKALEPYALTLSPAFQRYAVAHWGAIDGKNDWQDFDSVVIFGLHYHGELWASRTFMALQGPPEDDSWFDRPGWQGYQDIRKTMDRKQVTVSVIQAVNRIRCRRVSNKVGDCPPADVYLILPDSREGTEMLEDIKTEMPDIEIVPWDFELDGDEVNVRRKEGYEPVIAFMRNRPEGITPLSVVKHELGWTSEKMRELGKVIRDSSHRITSLLREMGISFVHSGKRGRGAQGCLVKA